MPRKPLKSEPWFHDVAKMMVKQSLSFRRAAEECGIILTPEEADAYQKRTSWEPILRLERYKYWEELGSDPNRTKQMLIGGMMYDIIKLREDGNYEKSLEGSLKLAKVEYGALNENQVSVLGGLSQEELDRVKARIADMKRTEGELINLDQMENSPAN